MQSVPIPAPASPEALSQAGAGALVLSVAVVDLWLAFWSAGWWHRSGALLVAFIGGVLLVRGVAALVAPDWAELARRYPVSRRVAAEEPPSPMLAELARR